MARQIPTPEGMSEPNMGELRALVVHSRFLDPAEAPNMVQALQKEEWLRDRLTDIYWKIDQVGDILAANEKTAGEFGIEAMWADLRGEWKRRRLSR